MLVEGEASVAAALGGDAEAFRELTDRYSPELHVHCYRMLGSFHDAEDGVQETLLRAWRYLASFERRSSFRAWLYRIATNVCLQKRQRRSKDQSPLTPPAVDAIGRRLEPLITTLTPYPDSLLDQLEATTPDPGADYDLRESVQLAFVAVMQMLPPRQRAALILHDVVGFSAAEVADLLDSTVASVNSALNRARATLAHERAAGRLHTGLAVPSDEVAESLARRCLEAWQAADIDQLAGLLKSDVVMGVPALRLRYRGRATVCEVLATLPPAEERAKYRFRLTRTNRQPAVAVYRLDPDFESRVFRAMAIVVLTTDGHVVAGIAGFPDPALLPAFGLPATLTEQDQ
jgi:RNA polymerase sigma-70 factor (ECF subfamily)